MHKAAGNPLGAACSHWSDFAIIQSIKEVIRMTGTCSGCGTADTEVSDAGVCTNCAAAPAGDTGGDAGGDMGGDAGGDTGGEEAGGTPA